MQLSRSHRPAQPQDDPTTRIGLAMTTLLRAAARAKAQDAAAGGVFHSMGLLWVLNESGPLRANLLADAVHADPSTLSRQVSALVDQGLIVREPDPADGRATLLAITPAGRTVFATRMDQRNRYLAGLTADWSAADREQFATLFERFASSFAAHHHDFASSHATDQPRTESS